MNFKRKLSFAIDLFYEVNILELFPKRSIASSVERETSVRVSLSLASECINKYEYYMNITYRITEKWINENSWIREMSEKYWWLEVEYDSATTNNARLTINNCIFLGWLVPEITMDIFY